MKEFISDIALKMATLAAVHSPRYPLYIPFEYEGKEWVLSYSSDDSYISGFFISHNDTNMVRLFEDIYDVAAFLLTENVNLVLLNERVDIAGRNIATMIITYKEQMEHAFGEGFLEESLPIREAIEDALEAHPKKDNHDVRLEYLAKMSEAPKPKKETKPHLQVVTQEDKIED